MFTSKTYVYNTSEFVGETAIDNISAAGIDVDGHSV